ncbi:hypothetical protein B0H11DRAFT_2236630 [Mycena galericulata]|nr:hypothetical protein B0H11DRAFT_2236630 [Mycena galericulata]
MSRLAQIRRHSPETQYRALLALGPTAYKKDGPGDVYFCARFKPSLVSSVYAGRLSPTILDTADIEIKVGSSYDVDVRMPQYAICERTQQPVCFWAYCTVPHRFLTGKALCFARFRPPRQPSPERLLHLKLKSRGATLDPEPCGGCHKKHREFYSLSVFQTLAEFKALVKSVVEDAGGVYNL